MRWVVVEVVVLRGGGGFLQILKKKIKKNDMSRLNYLWLPRQFYLNLPAFGMIRA